MTSPNSNGVLLSKEDAAQVAALRVHAMVLQQQGKPEEAWQCSAEACSILNRSTVQALQSGNFQSDELLAYVQVPWEFPARQANKGLHLELYLVEGTPLARAILELLEKDSQARA